MQLDGFRAFELIGSGGNAHVYRAQEEATGKPVAVKVLRGGGDETVRRRFERERSVMTELSSVANVVPVYQSGITPSGDPYLVMPLYTGGSLQDRVDGGPSPWQDVLVLTKSLAEAMALAHAKRILHLDIKPANVLLDDQGRPRLADFGISELMGNTSSMSAAMMTPAFTPPERFSGQKPGELTDIYGLVATMFALLTGSAPFVTNETTSPLAVMKAVAEEPLPMEALPVEVPTPVRNLLLRGMAKDPAERPRSAIELVGLLDDLLLGRDIDPPAALISTSEPTISATPASGAIVQSGQGVGPPPSSLPVVPVATQDRSGSKLGPVLVALGIVVVAIVGFGAVSAFGGGGDDGDGSDDVALDAVVVDDDSADAEVGDDSVSEEGEDVEGIVGTEESVEPDVEVDVTDSNDADSVASEVAGVSVEQESEPATQIGNAQPASQQQSSPTTAAAVQTTQAPSTERTSTTSTTSTTTAAPESSSSSSSSSSTSTSTSTSSTTSTTSSSSTTAAVRELEAGFVASGGPDGSEQTVSFRSITVGEAFAFEWRFGDGTTDTSGPNVSHTYSQPGTYQVTLTARADGTVDSATHTVRVDANSIPLEAGFVASVPNSSSPQTIAFANITKGDAVSYSWDFGDGASSTQQSPTHTYASSGTYRVTITARAADGASDSATHPVVVEANPVALEAGWTASPSASPNQQTMNFRSITIGPAVSYSWDFGDGSTGTGATTSHMYASPGTYSVTITARTLSGAIDSATHSLRVDPNS